MGTLKDIVDIINSSEAKDEMKTNLLSKKYSSIATRASEGTLQFPILISNSLDIETSQMIVKALERNYATFVQTVISMNSVTSSSDISEYLKQFHQNYKPGAVDKGDVLNLIKTLDENYKISVAEDGIYILSETYNNTSTSGTVKANKEQLINLLEDLNKSILNNKVIPRDTAIYHFKDNEKNAKFNAVKEEFIKPSERRIRDILANDYGLRTPRIGPKTAEYSDAERNLIANMQHDYDEQRRNEERREEMHQSDLASNTAQMALNAAKLKQAQLQTNTFDIPQQMLKDNDVKKANELISTVMHVRLHLVNDKKEPIGTKDFMLGVKGTMHPIKSEEMILNVSNACKNDDKVFNFLRWTTGEISFFKDFYLNLDSMKSDVYNESKGASRWWIALKNRRALGKASGFNAFTKNKILPNATIVISSEEAEIIKSQYGYDIMNSFFTSKIMKTYYLLGFVVVDNSAQVAHFMFDGDVDYQSVSFSGLEKENTRDERKFKEMLKVINRN